METQQRLGGTSVLFLAQPTLLQHPEEEPQQGYPMQSPPPNKAPWPRGSSPPPPAFPGKGGGTKLQTPPGRILRSGGERKPGRGPGPWKSPRDPMQSLLGAAPGARLGRSLCGEPSTAAAGPCWRCNGSGTQSPAQWAAALQMPSSILQRAMLLQPPSRRAPLPPYHGSYGIAGGLGRDAPGRLGERAGEPQPASEQLQGHAAIEGYRVTFSPSRSSCKMATPGRARRAEPASARGTPEAEPPPRPLSRGRAGCPLARGGQISCLRPPDLASPLPPPSMGRALAMEPGLGQI